ncbi:MAG: hypothetical protein AAGC58_09345 [Asticcacaulis sp.]|uniref:hypothetical protein n=1 Tax=Asticcacaulis tiandongensis TaxID=2565365 RepID=UPI00112A0637|nr:hypothetical protein [Asticcacaulis tiandongensis]
MATASGSNKGLVIGGLIAVIVIAVIAFLTLAPDNRTTGERTVDALESLPQGVDEAAGQFEDKSPLEKAADKAENATN